MEKITRQQFIEKLNKICDYNNSIVSLDESQSKILKELTDCYLSMIVNYKNKEYTVCEGLIKAGEILGIKAKIFQSEATISALWILMSFDDEEIDITIYETDNSKIVRVELDDAYVKFEFWKSDMIYCRYLQNEIELKNE